MGRVSQKFNFNWYVASVWCRASARAAYRCLFVCPVLREILGWEKNMKTKERAANFLAWVYQYKCLKRHCCYYYYHFKDQSSCCCAIGDVQSVHVRAFLFNEYFYFYSFVPSKVRTNFSYVYIHACSNAALILLIWQWPTRSSRSLDSSAFFHSRFRSNPTIPSLEGFLKSHVSYS